RCLADNQIAHVISEGNRHDLILYALAIR
ncbi:MAG: hypothetical protein QOJ42_2688, partial [Acidobacteriaceae bacterium]|nr:hypothetical protein [Acidobacteriaceae bacterium]